MKVLVLDLTHGGEVIAEEHLKRGDQVTALDIYGTCDERTSKHLVSLGCEIRERAPAETFDLAIAPVHCPERYLGNTRYKRLITHHQAVGELAAFKFPVIEVTGVHGKTSACHLLAHMISRTGKRVLLQTSRGVFSVEDGVLSVLKERSSIAPSSILMLSKIDASYDCGVFEVSLGGTGLATVSVITALGNNYRIAAGTKDAYEGKSQMIKLAKRSVVYPKDEEYLWGGLVPPSVKVSTFGKGGEVNITFSKLELGQPVDMNITVKGSNHTVRLPGSFLAPAYATAFAASIAAALSFGLSEKDIVSSLKVFNGVPGRGEVTKEGDWYLVRDRNPGVSAESVQFELGVLQDYRENDIGVVIDPVSVKVCEKLDIPALAGVMMNRSDIVKGAYMIVRPGMTVPSKGFKPISDITDVRGKHKVVLWCIKEGYA